MKGHPPGNQMPFEVVQFQVGLGRRTVIIAKRFGGSTNKSPHQSGAIESKSGRNLLVHSNKRDHEPYRYSTKITDGVTTKSTSTYTLKLNKF